MRINLHIDRLVVEGLDLTTADRRVLQAAIEKHLARQLAKGGIGKLAQAGGHFAALQAENIQVTQAAGPGELGRQVAGSIYGGIRK